MLTRPKYPGIFNLLREGGTDWIRKGMEIVNGVPWEATTFSGHVQMLLNNPEWATEYDPADREQLAVFAVRYVSEDRHLLRPLPRFEKLNPD